MTIIFCIIYLAIFVGAYVGVQLNKQEEQFVANYNWKRMDLQGAYDFPDFVAICNSRWEELSIENRQREASIMAAEMESPWEGYEIEEGRQDDDYRQLQAEVRQIEEVEEELERFFNLSWADTFAHNGLLDEMDAISCYEEGVEGGIYDFQQESADDFLPLFQLPSSIGQVNLPSPANSEKVSEKDRFFGKRPMLLVKV